ncbi:hypothetical protein PC129_g22297 [Phytophthora cactorum]|uniref:Uncharacterized protein n=1 Tax=Phytophthora cactorum TaxID=29920 RepID=A0A8T1ALP5_9STRA|nr:hypothetical protein Pcac1_g29025 [Phytophthora cactorum]KAG2793233.1 hypothetical protein PC111_g23122 [Phytophthora cactorum]KAG2819870.1 hypothetical protein PC113_g22674 [Phytophthora cactorum]KAG2874452.1 hypothetical protein PC114_g25273 [Phytophthora cactorum]KAG2877611.1 hypothetical protein PC115_g23324 [Phytophthora cactorum]
MSIEDMKNRNKTMNKLVEKRNKRARVDSELEDEKDDPTGLFGHAREPTVRPPTVTAMPRKRDPIVRAPTTREAPRKNARERATATSRVRAPGD